MKVKWCPIFYRRLGITSNLEINIYFDKMQKDMTIKKKKSRKVIKNSLTLVYREKMCSVVFGLGS